MTSECESASWYQDDDFWEAFRPLLFNENRLANTPTEVTNLLDLLHLTPNAAVLDLCCGIGRHSLELARRGYWVTGVDRTRDYLRRARESAQAEELSVEFIESDMREFERPDAFDAALSLFTSFGYFEKPTDDRKVVRHVYEVLRPGGAFVIDIHGKETLARIFRERDWHLTALDGEEILWLEERQILENWSRIRARWILIRGDKRREHSHTIRLYSALEMETLLKDCGFASVEIYGDLTGSPYNHEARRLLTIGRK